jgi:hypothetical protein
MTIMAKKKSDDRSKSRHKFKAIGLRLDDARRQQLQVLANAERRSLAQMAQILVEEALDAREKS